MTSLKNQMGFSLLEIAVGMALMSFLSIGLGTMILNQTNQVFYLEDKMSYQSLESEIKILLKSTNVCMNSLSAVPIPNNIGSISNNAAGTFIIRDGANNIVYDPSNSLKM